MASTVAEAFAATAKAHPARPFLIVPGRADRDWCPQGVEYSYGATLGEVQRLGDLYARAGYGHGHRVAILLENRPEFFFHYLALNALGAGIVPINPDYRHDEVAYLLEHSDAELAVVLPHRVADVAAAAADARATAPRRRVRTRCPKGYLGPLPPHAAMALASRANARCSTRRAPRGAPKAACCRTSTRSTPAATTAASAA